MRGTAGDTVTGTLSKTSDFDADATSPVDETAGLIFIGTIGLSLVKGGTADETVIGTPVKILDVDGDATSAVEEAGGLTVIGTIGISLVEGVFRSEFVSGFEIIGTWSAVRDV